MPENELRVLAMPAGLPSTPAAREKRDLQKAGHKIAAGLKSFLEVGLALKEIRDKRLYRQHQRMFEDYVVDRWGFSRPRAYELVAALDAVADWSANADIRVLPENEAQQPTVRDWVNQSITLKRGLCGAKPGAFCFWLLEMLNLQQGDGFHDPFERSGAVTRAFRSRMARRRAWRDRILATTGK